MGLVGTDIGGKDRINGLEAGFRGEGSTFLET